ncbi:hypothetical protein [Streptomyces sp. DH20]|uniref:hypothetical protein n=1 Tax=Streptomyces sp. DH20 TaxID=2857009 RepID=UPI001E447074|nr:hypothetical protein [Streptomyces sp. DH20]
MRTRTTLAAALLTLAALATGCTSDSNDDSSNDKPSEPTATVTQTVDTAAARQVCIDAWVALLQGDDEVGVEDEPAACDAVPGQSADMYAEALLKRNEANRERMDECLDDPTCTELPIP